MQVKKLAASRSKAWIGCGWQLFFKHRALWLAMSAIYVALAMLLMQLPFVGPLLLVLLTPALAAGAFMTSRELETEKSAPAARGASFKDRVQALFGRALNQLLRVFSEPDKVLSIMVIATLTLGAAVVVQVLAQLLHANTDSWPALVDGGVAVTIWLPWLLRLAFIIALKLVLALIMLYAVHQVVIGLQSPLAALENSVNACAGNAAPLSAVALVLVLPLIIATEFGGVTLGVIGLLILPVLLTSIYCSYKDIYH